MYHQEKPPPDEKICDFGIPFLNDFDVDVKSCFDGRNIQV